MAVYRFRIAFEDHEDVYREIEVLGKQTYEDLHRAIQEAIGFDNSKDASFFLSDDYWRKGQEIALRPLPGDEDDDDYPRRTKPAAKLMSKSRVADFIDDPHQRLLYVFDPDAKWTLTVELVRIIADDPKASYPRCSRSVGAAPKQYKQKIAPPPTEEEEEEDDEEEKKRKEAAVFTADEAFDSSEQPEGSEGEEEESVEGEAGEEGVGEGESEGGDFDAGEFGGGNDEDY